MNFKIFLKIKIYEMLIFHDIIDLITYKVNKIPILSNQLKLCQKLTLKNKSTARLVYWQEV